MILPTSITSTGKKNMMQSYNKTLAEGNLISVRSLQRSEGDVSDPIYS